MFYIRWLMQVVFEHYIKDDLNDELEILTDQLHRIDFHWFVHNDDNRIEDAYGLRNEYLNGPDALQGEANNFTEEVSVLEILVALVLRMSDLTGYSADYHFVELLKNLNIYPMSNSITDEDEIDIVIESLLERRYHTDGSGGLFPLDNPRGDQTKVEIWYQMMAYINERYGY